MDKGAALLPRNAAKKEITFAKPAKFLLKGFAPAPAKPRRAPPARKCRPDATTRHLKATQQKEAERVQAKSRVYSAEKKGKAKHR